MGISYITIIPDLSGLDIKASLNSSVYIKIGNKFNTNINILRFQNMLPNIIHDISDNNVNTLELSNRVNSKNYDNLVSNLEDRINDLSNTDVSFSIIEMYDISLIKRIQVLDELIYYNILPLLSNKYYEDNNDVSFSESNIDNILNLSSIVNSFSDIIGSYNDISNISHLNLSGLQNKYTKITQGDFSFNNPKFFDDLDISGKLILTNNFTIDSNLVTIRGSLQINGNKTEIMTANFDISDNIVKLASNANNSNQIQTAGIDISSGIASIKYKHPYWEFSHDICGVKFIGDVSSNTISLLDISADTFVDNISKIVIDSNSANQDIFSSINTLNNNSLIISGDSSYSLLNYINTEISSKIDSADIYTRSYIDSKFKNNQDITLNDLDVSNIDVLNDIVFNSNGNSISLISIDNSINNLNTLYSNIGSNVGSEYNSIINKTYSDGIHTVEFSNNLYTDINDTSVMLTSHTSGHDMTLVTLHELSSNYIKVITKKISTDPSHEIINEQLPFDFAIFSGNQLNSFGSCIYDLDIVVVNMFNNGGSTTSLIDTADTVVYFENATLNLTSNGTGKVGTVKVLNSKINGIDVSSLDLFDNSDDFGNPDADFTVDSGGLQTTDHAYVAIPGVLITPDAFVIEYVVKITSYDDSKFPWLFKYGNIDYFGYIWLLRDSQNNTNQNLIKFGTRNPAELYRGFQVKDDVTQLTQGDYVHFILQHTNGVGSGGKKSMWVNGVKRIDDNEYTINGEIRQSGSAHNSYAYTPDLILPAEGDTFYLGTNIERPDWNDDHENIKYIRIFNRTMNDREAKQLYNTYAGIPLIDTADTVVYFENATLNLTSNGTGQVGTVKVLNSKINGIDVSSLNLFDAGDDFGNPDADFTVDSGGLQTTDNAYVAIPGVVITHDAFVIEYVVKITSYDDSTVPWLFKYGNPDYFGYIWLLRDSVNNNYQNLINFGTRNPINGEMHRAFQVKDDVTQVTQGDYVHFLLQHTNGVGSSYSHYQHYINDVSNGGKKSIWVNGVKIIDDNEYTTNGELRQSGSALKMSGYTPDLVLPPEGDTFYLGTNIQRDYWNDDHENIKYIRIFNRTMNDSEATELYNTYAGNSSQPLQPLQPFQQYMVIDLNAKNYVSGNTLTDTITGNTVTLTSGIQQTTDGTKQYFDIPKDDYIQIDDLFTLGEVFTIEIEFRVHELNTWHQLFAGEGYRDSLYNGFSIWISDSGYLSLWTSNSGNTSIEKIKDFTILTTI